MLCRVELRESSFYTSVWDQVSNLIEYTEKPHDSFTIEYCYYSITRRFKNSLGNIGIFAVFSNCDTFGWLSHSNYWKLLTVSVPSACTLFLPKGLLNEKNSCKLLRFYYSTRDKTIIDNNIMNPSIFIHNKKKLKST